jgi:hypothetical protein
MGSRRPPPFSLRLTFEERAKIEADAAGMSLGGLAPPQDSGDELMSGRWGQICLTLRLVRRRNE